MSEEVSELEAALRILEGVVGKGDAPSHYVARHVLLALGAALKEGAPEVDPALLERARGAGEAAGPRWTEAVQAELAMACGEFAQCLDPRYLALPNYDVAYTLAARERVEARLRAARALGFELPERERGILGLADQVLETYGREHAPGRQAGSQAAGEGPGIGSPSARQ